ncbi:MAG: hypothetical protein C5B47_07605, partial [Verrucomicrobia bacterium]
PQVSNTVIEWSSLEQNIPYPEANSKFTPHGGNIYYYDITNDIVKYFKNQLNTDEVNKLEASEKAIDNLMKMLKSKTPAQLVGSSLKT